MKFLKTEICKITGSQDKGKALYNIVYGSQALTQEIKAKK